MSALGPSIASPAKNAARAGAAGRAIRRTVSRSRVRMDRGCNRRAPGKLRAAGIDAFRAGLFEPGLGLRVDTSLVPAQLRGHRLRDPARGLAVACDGAGGEQPEAC